MGLRGRTAAGEEDLRRMPTCSLTCRGSWRRRGRKTAAGTCENEGGRGDDGDALLTGKSFVDALRQNEGGG